jgi:periplasmic divalent cation tolerance protein
VLPIACSQVKRGRTFALVLVTAPDLKTGRRLARRALAERLVACVNLVPKIESHYWWKGKIEKGAEVLLIMKSTLGKVGELEKLVLVEHPYETPEFVVVKIDTGNRRYLKWVGNSCGE